MNAFPRRKLSHPLKLRGVMQRHELTQRELRDRIKHQRGPKAGTAIHESTLSSIVCHDVWPLTIDHAYIREATAKFLRDKGIAQEEIDTIWELDVPPGYQTSPHEGVGVAAAQPAEDGAPFQLPEAEMLSPTAREHFGLALHPFVDDVQGPQDVYLSKEQRYVRDSMYYAAKHGGFVAVVGESGSGKSTLRRDLIERISAQQEPIVPIQVKVIDKTKVTAEHICDAIIAELSHHEAPKLSLEAKARQIERILRDSARSGQLHVLIIEEAHDLTVRTVKYLKRFWELEDGFRKLIGIVLIGQPELGELLDEKRNYDAREVIRRCEIATLRPLNGNLPEYLALKFKRVGKSLEDIFEPSAFDAIKERLTRQRPGNKSVESHLYPLVVQNLVVKAMNVAAEIGVGRIDAALIRRV